MTKIYRVPTIKIFLDAETRSATSIKCGPRKYAEDPEAAIHCLCYAANSGPVKLWLPPAPPPLIFTPEHPRWDDIGFYAYNAEFELGFWEVYMHNRLGWPMIPDNKWYCIRVDALACGLPRSLDGVGAALDTKYKKDKEGAKLARMPGLTVPRKPTKNDLRRWFTRKEEPELFGKLYAYCKQDVRTQRSIHYSLPRHVTEDRRERGYFIDTIDVNRRGLPVDINTVRQVRDRVDGYKSILNRELYEITGRGRIIAGTQDDAIRKYLNAKYSLGLKDLTADTVKAELKKPNEKIVKRILRIRQEIANTTVAKYKRMEIALCKDGTVKNSFAHHGAITGRHAAKDGFQTQNLARPSPGFNLFLKQEGIDVLIECMWNDSYELLDLFHGGCTQLAKDLVRSMIQAPRGFKLLCADFKGVEARGVPWQCLDQDQLDQILEGKDLYKIAASSMYGIPYDQVDGYQRTAGKIAVLACGYQGGPRALIGMAEKYGLSFSDDEAQEIVSLFRAGRPKMKRTWRAFGNAAMMALKNTGKKVKIKNNKPVIFQKRGQWLYMKLPSGREISYPYPEIRPWKMPWGQIRPAVTCMWVNSKTHNWERHAISGGNLFQNCVQGTCRDLLMYSQHRLDKIGYPTILSLHDELMAIVPDSPEYNLPFYIKEMTVRPAWAADFPLAAEGWEGYRYRK